MTFEKAIEAMKQGNKVRRKVSSGDNYLFIKDGKMMIHNPESMIGFSRPSMLSTISILAEDWEIYEEQQKEPEMTTGKAIAFLQTVCGSIKIAKKNNVAHILYDGFDEAIDCINFAIEALENQNQLETEDNLNSDNETAKMNRAVEKYNNVIKNLYILLDFYKDNDFYRPVIKRAIRTLESVKEPQMTAGHAIEVLESIRQTTSKSVIPDVDSAIDFALECIDALHLKECKLEVNPEKKCECECKCNHTVVDADLQEKMKQALKDKFFELAKENLSEYNSDYIDAVIRSMCGIYKLLYP